eukprot:g1384.t1
MSFSDDRDISYIGKSLKFCRRLGKSIWLWRTGVSDNRQEGVELGAVHTASYPSLKKLPTMKKSSPLVSPFVKNDYSQMDVESVQDSDTVASDVTETLISSIVLPVSESKSSCSVQSNTADSAFTPPVSTSFTSSEEQEFNFLIRFANEYINDESFCLEDQDFPSCIEACGQGAIPCLLLNALEPETVDIRALNIPTSDHDLSFQEKKQNHILCINSLATISTAKETEILNPEKLVEGDKASILNLLWRIVNSATLGRIDVHRIRGLRALQEDEEDISHFLDLSSEDLLIRWVNWRLSQADNHQPIANLVKDLNDCSIYLKLQNEFQSELFNLDETLQDSDVGNCARQVLSNCSRLEMRTSHCSNDLLSGSFKMNAVFLSQMFLSNPGLEMDMESAEEDASGAPETDDNEGSREERTFRMWMNSVCSSMKCLSLFSESFRTGWMLLEVIDSMEPNSIDWSRTFKPPFKPIVKRIKSVENCNQIIQVAKDSLNLSLVGIGGDDIADGKRKPILALVWQLLRLHTLRILDSALESSTSVNASKTASLKARNSQSFMTEELEKTKLNENDVLSWANHMLSLSGSAMRINSFKDSVLSNGIALLDLLKAIEPNAIQEKHITEGITPEDKEMNAKYVLSVARKLGATIFIIWEDITEVKPKMILLLIASFMLLDKQRRRMHRAATINNKIIKSVSTS